MHSFSKILLILCLVISVIASVTASVWGQGTDWTLVVHPRIGSNGVGGPQTWIGSQTGATDLCDTGSFIDQAYSPTGSAPQAFAYEAGFGGLCTVTALAKDYKEALTSFNQKSWTIVAFMPTGYYPSPMRLRFYSTGPPPPMVLNARLHEYVITVLRDPTGTYTPGTQWYYPPGATGSAANPPLAKDFTNTQAIQAADSAAAAANGVLLSVVAQPQGFVGRKISGHVTGPAGPVGSVVLSLNTGGSVATDDAGYYEIVVPDGWPGQVAASLPSNTSQTFIPAVIPYISVTSDMPNQDYYMGTPMTTVSGHITYNSAALPGVMMTLSTDGIPTATTTTDDQGHYSFEVECGWSGEIRPSKAPLFFGPVARNIDEVTGSVNNVDFTAADTGPVYISGTILRQDGQPMAGVLVGGTDCPNTTQTNSSGYYALTVDSGWSGTITLSKAHCTFSPEPESYNNVTNIITARNYTATFTPAITGTVTSDHGVEWSATMTAYGNPGWQDYTVTTDGYGLYEFDVPLGWSGCIFPPSWPCSFTPSFRNYPSVTEDQSAQDFSGVWWPRIEGQVTDPSGNGVAGVTLTASNGGFSATSYGEDGVYALCVPIGWSGTVTPSKAGYMLFPEPRTYPELTANQTGQDYTARTLVTISGRVHTQDGEGLAGAQLTALWSLTGDPGWDDHSITSITNSNGEYSFQVPWGSNVYVSTYYTQIQRYGVQPDYGVYANVTADLTGKDYTATPYYLATGWVRDMNGELITDAWITVTAFDGHWSSSVNSLDGDYQVAVYERSTGTITCSREGYVFSPQTVPFEDLSADIAQDFVGTPAVTISGDVRNLSGQAVAGAVVNAIGDPGYPSFTTETTSTGRYILHVPTGWCGRVVPNVPGVTYPPQIYSNLTSDAPGGDFVEDTTPPTFESISCSPGWTGPGDPIAVTVHASDSSDVASVSVNGVDLVYHDYGWTGMIVAASGLGPHPLNVLMVDNAGNSTTYSGATYTTLPVVAVSIQHLFTEPFSQLRTKYVWRFFGAVTVDDPFHFDLSDGGPTPLHVSYSNHGFSTGDIVEAHGLVLTDVVNPPQLNAYGVKKLRTFN
jgi:hypothetical protein